MKIDFWRSSVLSVPFAFMFWNFNHMDTEEEGLSLIFGDLIINLIY
jgi:hypothetical protein